MGEERGRAEGGQRRGGQDGDQGGWGGEMHEGDGDGGDRKGADRRPEPEGAAKGAGGRDAESPLWAISRPAAARS